MFPNSNRTTLPEEEMKFRCCRMIGAFLPRWTPCLANLVLSGPLTTPESTAVWETLPTVPVAYPGATKVPKTATTAPKFHSLILGGVTTSTDCLSSHFVDSPMTHSFFTGLAVLHLRLRGEYDKIWLPLKVSVNLKEFHLAYEYHSEATPFQISEFVEVVLYEVHLIS